VTLLDTSALLVLDMQNDFLVKGGYYDEKDKRVRATRGQLSALDRDALARVYLHPPPTSGIREPYQDVVRMVTEVASTALERGMTTIFVQATYDPESRYRPPLFLGDPQRADYPCHPGSWGAAFVEPIKQLASRASARIVAKPTFDAFFETELHGFLHFKRIETVYIAGIETNVCVLFTACSALSNGFNTIIVEDCVAASQRDAHEHALQIFEVAHGTVTSKHDFLKLLGM